MNGTFQITGWDETPYDEGEGGDKKVMQKSLKVTVAQ
jgi:hypothetical protein